MVQNNANVSIDHSMIRWSNTSGLQATSTNSVSVAHSLLQYNVYGVSVVGGSYGVVHITDSSIADNLGYGVFLNWGGPPPSQSSITDSNIAWNGTNGVQLQVAATVPASLYPTGTSNNIWANTQKQLGVVYARYDLELWDGNYWGDDVNGPLLCPWAPTLWQFHLFYSYALDYPQSGPIKSATYSHPNNSKLKCAVDLLPVGIFSTDPLANQAPPF
jgi:hypothetical protein